MKEFLNYIQQLILKKFYGKIETSFEAGKIVHIREIKNIKLSEKRRLGNERD